MADAHDTEPEPDPDDEHGFHEGGEDEEDETVPMTSILSLSVESSGVKIEVTADGMDARECLVELVALAVETASKLRTDIQ